MPISATAGVSSGIDYQQLITQLLSVKKQPIYKLESDKSKYDKLSSAYETLGSKVDALKSAADDLRTSASFDVFTNEISDETILGATIGSTASKGSYDIVVSNIAKSHKIAADGVAADTTTVAAGAGSFNFTVGAGAEQSVAVDATTTLSDLRTAINDLDAGVTATIINDGDPANPYRLVLTSDDTGTSNAITITQNDTTLNFATTLQAATDASFTVDGMAVTKTSNTVTDVIEGVTLDLKSADAATTVTLNVARDAEAIEEKIQTMVTAYNDIVTYIKANNRYDSETKKAGYFFGDVVARSIWDDLRRSMTDPVSGLPDTMNRLLHVGITTDTEGKMSVDSTDLADAIAGSFDDVVNLFVDGTSTTGVAGAVYDKADSITDFADGRIKGRQDGLNRSITSIEKSIENRERELNQYEDMIRAQFMALETMLASFKSQSSFLMNMG